MRNETRIVAVIFEGKAQRHEDGHFTIPKRVAALLGLAPGDDVHLVIEDVSSKNDSRDADKEPLFEGPMQMKSGTEIYGLQDHINSGQLIRVRLSRPDIA